jgi:ABC-type antimicrobial peptide transport system permease subunit
VKLTRTAVLSARALLSHRLRTALALGSVSIGVAAVTMTGALSAGASREVTDRLEQVGTNLLVVRPAQVKMVAAHPTIRGAVTTLTLDDYEAIAGLDGVALAAPGAERSARVKAGNATTTASILGTTGSFPRIRNAAVSRGRWFTADEERTAQRVAVLGARVADSLFAGGQAVGRIITVGRVPFAVIGVLAAKGVAADGSDQDSQILVPVRTALRRVLNVWWLNEIFVRVGDADRMEEVVARIAQELRDRHRMGDDFDVQNTSRLFAFQQEAAASLDLLTTGLAALSLAIGGSGIIALMFMSVKERTNEIGLRMAVGAQPRDILVQFLCEATALSLLGWLCGVAVGTAAAAGLAIATDWRIAVPLQALSLSFTMALATGLVFGVIPARWAARVAPMQALLSQ